MSTQEYEYVAVKIGKIATNEDHLTKRLNEVATHGWRFVETYNSGGGASALLIFERPKH